MHCQEFSTAWLIVHEKVDELSFISLSLMPLAIFVSVTVSLTFLIATCYRQSFIKKTT
jgi:hypothetical protein